MNIPTIPQMDEFTRQLVLGDGYGRARVKNSSGKETTISWFGRCATDDVYKITARLDLINAVRAVTKTRAKSKMTHNYDKARADLEQRGLKFISGGIDNTAAKRPVAARIFYRSEGGEVLCCESEPMTPAGVDALQSQHPPFEWFLGAQSTPATSMDGILSVEIPYEVRERIRENTDEKKIPTHARFVIFPSQRSEPVETFEVLDYREDSTAGCGAGLLC